MSVDVKDPQALTPIVDQQGRLTVYGQQYILMLVFAVRDLQDRVTALEP